MNTIVNERINKRLYKRTNKNQLYLKKKMI